MKLKRTALSSSIFISLYFVLVYWIHISNGAFKDEQYLDSIACSSRHKIILFPNKTLVIKLSRWTDYHRGPSFLNFQCKFEVVAPNGYGIMAIIQHLHLRTKNMQGSSCRDSIRFEQSDGLEAGPICGEIMEGDRSEKPKTLLGSRSFYDPKGRLDVAFKFDDTQLEEIEKPFKLELSFTAYAECTSTSLLTRKVRQCSISRSHSCISENLFCDGVINCGYRGDFGIDETKCSPNVENGIREALQINHDASIDRFDLSKVNKDLSTGKSKNEEHDRFNDIHAGVPVQIFAFVSAISGAMVVLFVFFVCCCIVRNLSRRNLMQRHLASQRTIEISLSNSSSVPMSQAESEVPMHVIVTKSADDLPPSYEAIFPEPVPQKI